MSAEGAVAADYRQAAWSWTQHLRSAGSTRWSEWTVPAPVAAAPEDWSASGAAQLELVRRLAAAGLLDGPTFTALADLVLRRSGPGRGLSQQPLSWPDAAPSPFGAPPTDPGDVPVEELLRVGVGTLTELLAGAPDLEVEPLTVRRRPLTRSPAFELGGAPVTTSVVRRRLALAGHVEGGWSPRVVLLVEPFDLALAQVWSARVQAGAAVRWGGFLRRWAGRPSLPPSVDLPALARHWAGRVGPANVHLVVGGQGASAAVDRVADVLGVDVSRSDGWLHAGAPASRADPLSSAGVDVLRRVNAVLNVRVPEARRAALRRVLVATLRTADPVAPALTVPATYRDWARGRGERIVQELTAGGYRVHGCLDDAMTRGRRLPSHPHREDALDLVVQACLAHASSSRLEGRDA